MLNTHNPHVKTFRTASDKIFALDKTKSLRLVLSSHGDLDGRIHNVNSTDEVDALVVGGFGFETYTRDIVIESQTDCFQHISELHPAYLSLQYLFSFFMERMSSD